MKSNKGFTLIELVVVIVILGILAATALPKFIDFKGDAESAAAEGVAGALGSATAMNYAKRQISSTAGVAISSGTPCNSTDITGLLTDMGDAQLSSTAVGGSCTAGTTGTCVVTVGTNTANATITCTGS